MNVTLTLPGIAGVILSIGMAVDANVIIFTRIREELATGKTVKSSIRLVLKKQGQLFSTVILQRLLLRQFCGSLVQVPLRDLHRHLQSVL